MNMANKPLCKGMKNGLKYMGSRNVDRVAATLA